MNLPLRFLFTIGALVCIGFPQAKAQATRTWVSGVGDDANPCSRTAPCKTFAGAISKTAAGGEINTLDPGGFGAVTITKSIRLDGSTSGTAGILASGTTGIIISAPATDTVVLRNLTINGGTAAGLTRGIRFISGKALIIENCDIYGFGQRAISIETTNEAKVFIRNTNVHANFSNGIMVQPLNGTQARVTLTDVRINDNVNYGILVYNGGAVTFRGGAISNHGLSAVRVDASGGPATLNLQGVTINDNVVGIQVLGGSAMVRLMNSDVLGNGTGLDGAVYSSGSNRIAGNAAGNGPPTNNLPLQ